jgi:hypothetical protein
MRVYIGKRRQPPKVAASLTLHRRIHIHKVKNMLILTHKSLLKRLRHYLQKACDNQSHPIPKISREVSIPLPETGTKTK